MPAGHGLLLVAAQRARAVPAQLRKRDAAGVAPTRRACGAGLPSVASACAQSRRERAVAASPVARSRKPAAPRAREFEPASLAQHRFDGGAGEYIVAVQERHAQPAARLRRSADRPVSSRSVSNACATSGKSASGWPPSIANTVENARAPPARPTRTGDSVCDSRRSYCRRRCRSFASTMSSRRPGSRSSSVAAPGGDQFELVLVVLGGRDRDGAAPARIRVACARAPSRRSVSCARRSADRQRRRASSFAGGGCSSPSQARKGLRPCSRTGASSAASASSSSSPSGETAERARRTRRCASRAACAPPSSSARASAGCRPPRGAIRAGRPTPRRRAAVGPVDWRAPTVLRAARSANWLKVRTRGVLHSVRPGVALLRRPTRRAPPPGAARSARAASRRRASASEMAAGSLLLVQ